MTKGRSASLEIAAAVLLWALLASIDSTHGQMAQPLQGQGLPQDKPVDVHVSALLERLLEIDDTTYRFESQMYIYLSWEDPRARQAVLDATTAYRNGSLETCNRPCIETSELPRNAKEFTPEYECCDCMWLPSVKMLNAYSLPEDRLQPYGITVDADTGAVGWWTAIQAVYFTPMDFHRFPFDSQTLVMQFSCDAEGDPHVGRFIASATSTRWMVKGEGDIVSGWDVEDVVIYPQIASADEELDYFISNFGRAAAASDPSPVHFDASEHTDTHEGEEPGRVSKFVGFHVDIMVTRFGRYYVLNMIAPLLLLVCLSFITYIIPPSSLDARIALNVTLFLSLTALQFVVNDQLPKSSYPSSVTELILVCYAVVSFTVPETIVVYVIMQRHEKLTSEGAVEELNGADEEETYKAKIWKSIRRRPNHVKLAYVIDMCALFCAAVTVLLGTILTLSGVV